MKRRPAGRRFCWARPASTARHDQTVGKISVARAVREGNPRLPDRRPALFRPERNSRPA
ncbi:hypothetical protein RZS08_16975 [Arthrospira platensis SPKY1]|nr:hypothetical protein [Arthrospira platensis SPKY1]